MLRSIHLIFTFLIVELSLSQVTATQKIPNKILAGTEYIAEITINKGTNSNYIRFSQKLPTNFTATEMNSKGGKFSFKDSLVRIRWIFPPAEEEFTVTFKVSVGKETNGEKKIKGRVYYFFNTRKEIFQFEPQIIQVINEPDTAKENIIIKKDSVSTIVDISKTNSDTVLIPKANINLIKDTILEKPEAISPIVIEEKKIEISQHTKELFVNKEKTYRVQIAAVSIKNKFKDVPEVSTISLDNGITKYFSGNFTAYEEAINRKKSLIKQGFKGAFIVPFENGKIAQ